MYFSPKKTGIFFHFFGVRKKKKRICKKGMYYATFQCRCYSVFKKILKFFFDPKKWKNRPQKLLIIGPDPFISQSSPDLRPTAQIWFFILWNLGTRHLFSYLWVHTYHSVKNSLYQRQWCIKHPVWGPLWKIAYLSSILDCRCLKQLAFSVLDLPPY